MVRGDSVFFQTDGAWDFAPEGKLAGLEKADVREESKALRFVTTAGRIEAFAARHAERLRPFTLFGSGDFHHLSAVWIRQFTEPFVLLSFDNHPDWDIRPPKWSCGAWINRALENRLVQEASIWGCGNFECDFPWRLLGNRAAAQTGRLTVQPWARGKTNYPAWLSPLTPETWRPDFLHWLERHDGGKVYVTIDLDCLASGEAVTNWENGRFTCDDLLWALAALREKAQVIGGDLCGTWAPQEYATTFQRLAGWFDHPAMETPSRETLQTRNLPALEKLWPALTGEGKM